MNPYEVLNVTPLSSDAELKEAYRVLCERYPKETHPDERQLVEDAYQEIVALRQKTGNKMGTSPVKESFVDDNADESAEHGSIEQVKLENQEQVVVPSKKKRIWPIVLGFIAVFLFGMWLNQWMNSDDEYVYESDPYSEEASVSDDSSDSKPIESSQDEAIQEAEETKAEKERERREAKEQQLEEAVNIVNEWGPLFFYEVQYALSDRSASGMGMATSKFRNEFQPTLTNMVDTNVIFEGEIEVSPIHKREIIEVSSDKIIAKVRTDYSSLSYSPYLKDEPEGSRIEWQLTFVKQDGDWLVDERKLLSDSSKGRIDPVREEVKDDIVETIDINATEWLFAYQYKDTSYFSRIGFSDYYERQESYYKVLDQNNWYWQGEYLGLEYSYDSIVIDEGANPLSATIEARANYFGNYYDEDTDEFAELDDSEPSVFRYVLEYDYYDQSWYIVNTKLLKEFSKGDVRTYTYY
ncbi:J domain-containing protein [Exiguobacterium marinum]|uniref:J domain-containing protein n=1 Tax=Exiguobacterium marinum TaxID=273528 RepID=A0ABY7X097_9BACL|nr:J domain-containing protein [Exiguobacterium marinum]WDH75346.1 J domain-containing protein [Exiguobacterium marinum]